MAENDHKKRVLSLMKAKPRTEDVAGYHGTNTHAILMMAIHGVLLPGINPPGKIFYSPTQSGIHDMYGEVFANQFNKDERNGTALEEAAHYASMQEGNVHLTNKFGEIMTKLHKPSYVGLFESPTIPPIELLEAECGDLADGLYTYLKGLFYTDKEIIALMKSIADERRGVLLTFRRSVCELAEYDEKEGTICEGLHIPTTKGLYFKHIASIKPLGPKEEEILSVLSGE